MSKSSATIKDVAAAAGCSVSTVSYALNGGPRRVSEDTVERVRTVAEDLGYRPPRLAGPVAPRRARTLGLISGCGSATRFDHAIIKSFLGSIAKAAAEEGYHLHLFCPSPSNGRSLASQVRDGGCDGILLMAPFGVEEMMEQLHRDGTPMIALCGALSPHGLQVSSDNEGGLRQAISHLIRLGHRKIAYVGGRHDLLDGRERLEAFRRLAKEFRLEAPPHWMLPGDFTAASGWTASRSIIAMADRPTAIVCANDDTASGLMYGLRETGFRVPQDFSVTGFDDSEFSRYTEPPLTTVRQNTANMSQTAVRILCEAIAGGRPAQKTLLATELIVRSSTAHP